MLHDRAEDGRLQMLPVRPVVLGDGDEIVAEEHAGHAGDRRTAGRQAAKPARSAFGVAEIGGAGGKHFLAGQEFQGRRIRGRLGLDEHGRSWPCGGRSLE